MPISPARIAAFEVLLRVETTKAYASELLHASRYARLSPADHGLATEIAFGVLRWRSFLDQQIAEHSSVKLIKLDAEVLTALRIGAYQIIFLDRVARHAAVHESVELVKRSRKRSAVPYANAVLRRLSAESLQSPISQILDSKTPSDLVRTSSHPEWLVERWIQEFGFETTRKICHYDQLVPETVITVRDSATGQELVDDGLHLAPGELVKSARRLVSGDPTQTRALRSGAISIQDEASQLVALLVGRGKRVLDCCAAPGGKTKILAEQNPSTQILAFELHPHRARLLRKRIASPNVHVVAADVRQLPTTATFDRILVDAPCSGTGTLARNPEIKWHLQPEDLLDLQARQIAILNAAIERLAHGGQLVYSTCSLEKEENEAVIEAALSAHSSIQLLNCHDRLQELRTDGMLTTADIDSLTRGPYLRTIPGLQHCDGFFAAILRKT